MVLNKVMVVEMILIIENNYGLISIKIMNFINLLINLFKPENLVKLGMLNMLKDIKLTITIYFLKVKFHPKHWIWYALVWGTGVLEDKLSRH